MKVYIKRSLLLLALITIIIPAFAQLKPGMMIQGVFNSEVKLYVAEITAVSGNTFTCCFVKSGSSYTFLQKRSASTGLSDYIVIKNTGGKFAKGEIFHFVTFQKSDCSLESIAGSRGYECSIVTFSDGKSFLGNDAVFDKDLIRITMTHSRNVYVFKKDGTVESAPPGGAYKKGTKAKLFCAVNVEMPL